MKPVKVFYCYAHEDRALRSQLEKHLSPLKRLGHIVDWCDHDIKAGTDWQHEINSHLQDADVILLLLSPSFIASDYCYTIEMQRALKRHQTEDAYMIPIILRPIHWQDTPLGSLQALPTDGKPVIRWQRRDDAYWDIVNGANKVVKPLLAQRWRDEGDERYTAHEYEQALSAYNQAILLEPTYAEAYYCEGNVLFSLKYYDEARIDYEQAIHFDPDEPSFYLAKAVTLLFLQQYQEALALAEKAITLDPEYVDAYHCKQDALIRLRRFQEADEAASKAKQIEEELKNLFMNS